MEELTVSEAAERLGISEQAVRKRVQRGTIPCAKPSDGRLYVYLDSEMRPVKHEPGAESPGTESASQITLQYIDKLFASYRDVMSAQGRAYLTMIALSIVLLAISGGAASAEGKLAVAGFGLRVPVAVFLTGAALYVALLAAATHGGALQMLAIRREIQMLYDSIGFWHRSLGGAVINPFRGSTMGESLFSWYLRDTHPEDSEESEIGPISNVLMALLHLLVANFFSRVVPIAAVIGTGFKVTELLHGRGVGWTWVLFVAVVGFIVAAFITISIREVREQLRERGGEFSITYIYIFPVLFGLLGSFVGSALGYFVAKVLGSS